jgi:hypothetical protein
MNEAKKRQIEWFLRFIDADFKSQRKEELFTLLHDMKSLFVQSVHRDLNRLLSALIDPDMILSELTLESDKIVNLQDKLRSFLKSLMGKFYEAKQHEGKERDISELDIMLKQRILGRFSFQAEAQVIIRPEKRRDAVDRHLWRAVWPKGAIEKSPIELEVVFDDEDTGLIFMFVRTLEGVRLDSIHQCHECKKWIVQTGKREKRYCSSLCRSRKNNRVRRDNIKEIGGELYEDELEKGKKRAKQSREKQIKKKLGSNVVIGKSTRKKKEDGNGTTN